MQNSNERPLATPPVYYMPKMGLVEISDPDMIYTVEGWRDVKTYDFKKHMPPPDAKAEAYLSKPGNYPCGIVPRYPWYYSLAPPDALLVEGDFVTVRIPWRWDQRTGTWCLGNSVRAAAPSESIGVVYSPAHHLDGCECKKWPVSAERPPVACTCRDMWSRDKGKGKGKAVVAEAAEPVVKDVEPSVPVVNAPVVNAKAAEPSAQERAPDRDPGECSPEKRARAD
eukprot:jgi/Mesvir1/26696/Mv20474-RA.1